MVLVFSDNFPISMFQDEKFLLIQLHSSSSPYSYTVIFIKDSKSSILLPEYNIQITINLINSFICLHPFSPKKNKRISISNLQFCSVSQNSKYQYVVCLWIFFLFYFSFTVWGCVCLYFVSLLFTIDQKYNPIKIKYETLTKIENEQQRILI